MQYIQRKAGLKKIEKYFNVIKWFGSGPQLTLATYLDKFQLSEFLLGP